MPRAKWGFVFVFCGTPKTFNNKGAPLVQDGKTILSDSGPWRPTAAIRAHLLVIANLFQIRKAKTLAIARPSSEASINLEKEQNRSALFLDGETSLPASSFKTTIRKLSRDRRASSPPSPYV
jgi:hypothetical protein